MKDPRSVCTLAVSSVVIAKGVRGKKRKEHCDYRSVIGMINFLVNCTHPEMAYRLHQCTRFYKDPKHIRKQAIKRIIRYLFDIRRNQNKRRGNNQGIIYCQIIVTYADALFDGD